MGQVYSGRVRQRCNLLNCFGRWICMNGVLLRNYRRFGHGRPFRLGTPACIYLLNRKSITKFVIEIKVRMNPLGPISCDCATCLRARLGCSKYSQSPPNATPLNATPRKGLSNWNQFWEWKSDFTRNYLSQNATALKLKPAYQICVSTDLLHLEDFDCIPYRSTNLEKLNLICWDFHS